MSSVNALVLASASPFRRQLLEATGIAFTVKVAPVDERTITADDPRELARRRSEAKALAAAATLPGALVIGADQVLGLEGRSFDKVMSAPEAEARLALLAGRTHELHTGMALAMGDRLLSSEVIDVPMPMRPLEPEEIAAYVATGEWRGSVGCYQFENRGVHLFESVDSDHATIVGLPLQRLLARLRTLGVDGLRSPAGPWRLRDVMA